MDVLEQITQAFRNDDAPKVAELLDQNPELKKRINEPIGPFDSPAITCARSPEMLDVLLAAGADIDAKSQWWAGGFGLLHTAEPPLAEAAIQRGATIDAHAAARLGRIDVLRDLLAQDPNLVHAPGGDGKTPLHFAKTVEIAKLLLDNGADIDALDVDHESTPAQYLLREAPDVARFLVAEGAKTDILMGAALGDKDLANKILDENPDAIRTRVSDEYFPMINDKTGGTIYQWVLGWHVSAHQVAKEFGHEDLLDLLMERSPREVKVLANCWLGSPHPSEWLASKEDLHWQTEDLRQVAHAARNNQLEAVRCMLQAGLPVMARGQHSGTPLHWAAWHGNKEMIDLLLAHGAELEDVQNDYQSTPLQWAIHASVHGWNSAGNDHPAVVETLVKAGAKIPAEYGGTEAVKAVLNGGR